MPDEVSIIRSSWLTWRREAFLTMDTASGIIPLTPWSMGLSDRAKNVIAITILILVDTDDNYIKKGKSIFLSSTKTDFYS